VLHMRVIAPTDVTAQVLDLLDTEVGVAHVILNRGAARKPAGDLIEADVAREAADSVLGRLADLGIDHTGAITMEELQVTLSDTADLAERDAPGDGDEAIVWDELMARTANDSRANGIYLAFLILALLIATAGVVTDSPVTVVGAMAVAPDFGPLAGFAVGIFRRRWDLVKRSAAATLIGFGVAMLVTAAFAALCEVTGLISLDAPGLGKSAEVDFIYDVGPFSLIVALFAGAAGMLSLLSAKSAVLVGVFISVTTVPAAAYAVVAATLGYWSRFGESLAQLVVNLAGIVIAATVVLAISSRVARRRGAALKPGRPLSDG
jgi:uncharacterized hydrophobic protein (TIGR00271 family)